MDKTKVVVVVGTNASGKSALGVRLAGTYDGEIISADSRQVFRGLDLGSGKITPEEMQGVPHYMIDVREPGEFFSMADFQRMSYEKIDEIRARGHLPMIVGGTGLYVDSVLDGYLLSDKEPDLAYRAELEKLTTPALYAQLVALVPDVQVERNNRNRVMRMLERIHDGDDAVPAHAAAVFGPHGVELAAEIVLGPRRLQPDFGEGVELAPPAADPLLERLSLVQNSVHCVLSFVFMKFRLPGTDRRNGKFTS